MSELYYTYRYFDPDRSEFFYVGKGKDSRAFCHMREAIKGKKNTYFHNRLRKMHLKNIDPIIDFICKDVDEEFALFVEIEAIAKYGRKNLGKGPLCNMTNGGDGTSGKLLTQEHIAKLKVASKTPEARAKASASLKGHVGSFRGKKQYPGHMEKMSLASVNAAKANNYAHLRTPEYRQKISAVLTGKKRSDESRVRYSAAAKIREAKKKEERNAA